jgi:maltose O-acetyltransferase
MVRHFINIILYFFPPSRLFALRRILLRFAGVNLANSTSVCGRGWVYGRGILKIGKDTWLSPGVLFYTHNEAGISLGSRCDIGPDVSFIVGSHLTGNSTQRAGKGVANSIVVGDGTWIGAGVTVLDGVTIGTGCIVAAGALVNRNIEDNCLAAGVPIKVKRKLDREK